MKKTVKPKQLSKIVQKGFHNALRESANILEPKPKRELEMWGLFNKHGNVVIVTKLRSHITDEFDYEYRKIQGQTIKKVLVTEL